MNGIKIITGLCIWQNLFIMKFVEQPASVQWSFGRKAVHYCWRAGETTICACMHCAVACVSESFSRKSLLLTDRSPCSRASPLSREMTSHEFFARARYIVPPLSSWLPSARGQRSYQHCRERHGFILHVSFLSLHHYDVIPVVLITSL